MKRTTSEPFEFSCHAPKVKAVFLAGTFNDWKPDVVPLHPHLDSGDWFVTLPLPPGRHEYKFVIDGVWCSEPSCDREYPGYSEYFPNEFGTMNRVLEVS